MAESTWADINPFDDLIVKEPSRKEVAVPGLNEKQLQKLIAGFERVAPNSVPFIKRQVDQAWLVTSAQPGYGKSHLIGQLFRALHGRATLIYVRPFQNTALAFQSLLGTVVREMHFPDNTDRESWKPEDPTQLDILALNVLGYLVADLAERQGDLESDKVEHIRRNPVAAFGLGAPGDVWADWMRATFTPNRGAFEAALARRGVRLNSPEWLKVLFAYGFGYPDREIRQACLDWMSGQSLSAEVAEAIGVRPAEAPVSEQLLEDANQLCRSRLIDLCELSVFYRPFVFCFDQTEAYGHSPTLARIFGMVVATIVDEAPNHFTLVTSNRVPWEKTITPYFEDADTQRIAHPPVALEGLTRAQGEQLIHLRLEGRDVDPKLVSGMLNREWLESFFKTDRERRGTRRFLQECKERWEILKEQQVEEVSLEDLYEAHRITILSEPKRLLFDPDILQWLVKVAARGLPGWNIGLGAERYFPVGWTNGTRWVIFCFEAGSNWNRWAAIARESRALQEREPTSKAVVFRGAEQTPIPEPGWRIGPEIEEAKKRSLDILVLGPNDFAALYAGYDLYADALAGDIPSYSEEEVISFLGKQFEPWWKLILELPGGAATVAADESFVPMVKPK